MLARRSQPEWPASAERLGDADEEVRIVSGGVPIALSVWHAEAHRGTVVFLAGTMVHPLFYREFLDGLSSAGFAVVGVHAQGHGRSPRTGAALTWEALLRNAQDGVTYALDRFGHPVIVVGSSQGGMLAVALAATGVPVDGVLAHNILDPSDPAALRVTRFPRWLRVVYRPLRWLIAMGGRLLPRLPVPIEAYLDLRRVCGDRRSLERFRTDPLALQRYPLGFLAGLFTADLSGMTDGRIRCPVTVLAASGDPLFPTDDARRLFDRIEAPRKRFVEVDLDRHLIFNECVPEVLPRVVAELATLAAPSDAQRGR
jgi:alpha-beta hydrolase superfamily lysophospholipase